MSQQVQPCPTRSHRPPELKETPAVTTEEGKWRISGLAGWDSVVCFYSYSVFLYNSSYYSKACHCARRAAVRLVSTCTCISVLGFFLQQWHPGSVSNPGPPTHRHQPTQRVRYINLYLCVVLVSWTSTCWFTVKVVGRIFWNASKVVSISLLTSHCYTGLLKVSVTI
jgi:hypothetical protein